MSKRTEPLKGKNGDYPSILVLMETEGIDLELCTEEELQQIEEKIARVRESREQ